MDLKWGHMSLMDEKVIDVVEIGQAIDDVLAQVEELAEPSKQVALKLKEALEKLYGQALREIVVAMKSDDHAKQILYELVDSPSVRMALSSAGVLRPSLVSKAAGAIDQIRPFLKANGATINLVGVNEGNVVIDILDDASNGLPSNDSVLFTEVRSAVLALVPELSDVVSNSPINLSEPITLGLKRVGNWIKGPSVLELQGKAINRFDHGEMSFVIANYNGIFRCFKNQCPHQGNTLDDARLDEEGVLTCSLHGYRFDSSTGECITMSGMDLFQYALDIKEGHLMIKVTSR